MTSPLPEDLARLFAAESPLPAPNAVRQAAVKARLWRTLGLDGAPPPAGSGGRRTILGVIAAVSIGVSGWLLQSAKVTGAVVPQRRATAAVSAHTPAVRAAASHAVRFLPVVPMTEPEVVTPDWFGQLAVAPRAISGRVTVAGHTLSGAIVTLSSPATAPGGLPLFQTTSDAAGQFEFAAQPTWLYLVSAEASGWTAATAYIDTRNPRVAPESLTLELTACASPIAGVVSDSGGGAIVGARVTALGDPWSGPSALTDAVGHYSLCLAPTPQRLRFEADGYGARTQLIAASPRSSTVDQALAEESIVSGSVHDAAGGPLVHAQINLWHRSGSAAADARVISDSTGHFEAHGIAAGDYRVNAWMRDSMLLSVLDLTVPESGRVVITLALSPTARISGVVTRDGHPAAGVRIVAARVDTTELRSSGALTQADGRFTASGVVPGEIMLLADEHIVVSALSVTLAGRDDVVVELSEPAK